MKTKTKIFGFFGIAIVSALFFSCNNPIGLGARLDVEGPVVHFTAPTPRKVVDAGFAIEGTASDFSGIETLLIRVTRNNSSFPKQWRYSNGRWEVSENSGTSWAPYAGASWNGSSKSASWKVPIDMYINGIKPVDGEYMFSIQAWDTSGFSDDNSFKTRVLIYDSDPPKVEVSNPYLYTSDLTLPNTFSNVDLQPLHNFADLSGEWKKPAMIGKFLTQEFDMQWLIEDSFDLWSIDIRFYKHDIDDGSGGIDNDPDTDLPAGYIYQYHENVGPPPPNPAPGLDIKPNGKVEVPRLDGIAASGTTPNGSWELLNPITEKTTIRVVAVCYDAAGHPNQEKTLGYFIYWPLADYPWITYADGMKEDFTAYGSNAKNVYMVYPGRKIKATAFHAMGVKSVTYKLFAGIETKSGDTVTNVTKDTSPLIEVEIPNPPNFNGFYSTIFPWEIEPPTYSGFFFVEATSCSVKDKTSVDEGLFIVQDITFPNFIGEPKPDASKPLFESMNTANGTITISGKVADATAITSLCMVWINPQSTNYATMSQLEYFRDSTYAGWAQAKDLTTTAPVEESTTFFHDYGLTLSPPVTDLKPYDTGAPNKIWQLLRNPTKPTSPNPDTKRYEYDYTVTINLASVLNIAANNQPLKSQMFLLRAENQDGKCTIITYAPQGDEVFPKITITSVEAGNVTYTPASGWEIPPQAVAANSQIIINGTWTEDSAAYLAPATYLYPNLEITVNEKKLGYPNATGVTGGPTHVTGAGGGTFRYVATVGSDASSNALKAADLKDAVVVSAKIKDFGGNPAEDGASWLIQSETVQFLRISSTNADKTYTTNDSEPIRIFLEFTKPVQLKSGRALPVLLLNSTGTGAFTGTATYEGAYSNTPNTRQMFIYQVADGHNTTDTGVNSRLNVTGGRVMVGGTASNPWDVRWNQADYPFTFVYTPASGVPEEIRITATNRGNTANFDTAVLPTATTDMTSLYSGKEIKIDTREPTVSSITATTKTGWYTTDAEIYINVKFSKSVMLGAVTPWLTFSNLNNAGGSGDGSMSGTNTTSVTPATNVRVNGDTITFMYKVKAGDNTQGNALQVADFGGDISDLAGKVVAGNAIYGMSAVNRTLAGIYLDTIAPATAPTVELWGKILGTETAASQVTPTAMLYHDSLELRFAAQGSANQDRFRLEYSTNGGTNWNAVDVSGAVAANANYTLVLPTNGFYDVRVRQYDAAGNLSPERSLTPSFTWDKGPIITSISSTTPNGTYTFNGQRQDTINITVFFRKAITVTGTPQITLNSRTTPVNGTAGTAVSSLSFTYNVASGENTPGTNRLNVSALNIASSDVPAAFMTLPASNLSNNKEIYVQTTALTQSVAPAFTNNLVTGGGTVQADGSYPTALTVTFARPIQKGSGTVTVRQIRGTNANTYYRLPSVLTEAQYNRFKTVPALVTAGLNKYYIRGTNGYNRTPAATAGPDTSAKYVLNYAVDTAATANAPGTGTGSSGDLTYVPTFAEAFRQAEAISIPVTSSQVRIVNGANNGQLIVELTGNNALQVPGATYEIIIPPGFMQDALGFPSPEYTAAATQLTAGGVARPFIRVKKPDEAFAAPVTGNDNTPRYSYSNVNTDILQTYARMDCRTPGAAIRYNATISDRNNASVQATAQNFGNALTGGDPGVPGNIAANNNGSGYTAAIQLGNTNYEGYQWRAYARAFVGTTASDYSEEMAYRTVLTYRTVNMNNDAPGQNLKSGDQVWIRGGDAISSSNIPGFPLTWEDDWAKVAADKSRAGIRLLIKENTTDGLNNSTYYWVTWEVNVPVYYDIIMGHDTASSAVVARQYGPVQFAPQRAGWTSFKEDIRLVPGKHRYVQTNEPNNTIDYNSGGKGAINFSGTMAARPSDMTYP